MSQRPSLLRGVTRGRKCIDLLHGRHGLVMTSGHTLGVEPFPSLQQNHVPPMQGISNSILSKLDLPIPKGFAHWALASHEIDAIWQTARRTAGANACQAWLEAMQVSIDVADQDLARIPRSGPVLVVANHPHGILDGIVAGALLSRVRRDFKILANSLLTNVPELVPHVIAVDPFGRREDVRANAAALLAAYRHLKSGGALIAFPAGEVSSLQPGLQLAAGVTDREWHPTAIELAMRAGAAVVPLFLGGRNGNAFQAAGLIHPALRTALLGRELVNKKSRRMQVAVGSRIRAEALRDRDGAEATLYVRNRVYALGQRAPEGATVTATRVSQVEIAAAGDAKQIEAEVTALPPDALLFQRGDWAVYLAEASAIPSALTEIGRLREVTFRAVGEGSGQARDLDPFDAFYRHLFLWNRAERQIVGAYRIGNTRQILEKQGMQGLYTRTLFRYGSEFLSNILPGLELGRSFVRQEYQRHAHCLSYLWKGVGTLLARDRSIRYLFGPVSISADYSAVARELIVAYFEKHGRSPGKMWVAAQRPPKRPILSPMTQVAQSIQSIGELSELVADLDGGRRGIPVLLRHYMNLGGRVVGFNVDRKFSNALDALVILDLEAADAAVLQRYTGLAVDDRQR